MSIRTLSMMYICAAVVMLGGCTQSESEDAPTTEQPTTQSGMSEAHGLPEALFAASAPSDAQPLINVKRDARPGDTVTFEARIGGRLEPFVDGRAMFIVTDPSIKSCDQLPGDACPTPWDYCCEPKDSLLKHMATVQVVGPDGRPLNLSLKGEHGLKPLRTVYVTGTVNQADESGAFMVNAESIHVVEG